MQGNLKEVSRFLGHDYSKTYRLYQRGLLPVRRVGGRLITDVERLRVVLEAYGKQSESLPTQSTANTFE